VIEVKYPRIFHLLRVHGHSGERAAEIIVSAKRKDPWSIRWIKRAHAMTAARIWIKRRRDMGS
jgi:hypothetical protein